LLAHRGLRGLAADTDHQQAVGAEVQRLAARGLLNPDDEDPFSLFVAR
jgi:hypothetical protein